MNVYRQTFYERHTGVPHKITTDFMARRVYEVRVDGEFYATAENRVQAYDEVVDILKTERWTPIRPF